MDEKWPTADLLQNSLVRERVILHMDGDAFFVAVEVAKNPALKGLPVVTGQERGIVSALSYEAKALGVTRGMPIYTLRKKFPQVIVMAGDYISYMRYSRAMFTIVRRYADDVEEYSIDECFAELTGLDKPLKMSYLEIAQRIKKEVMEELAVSVTVGLAPTKVLAKVASKWVKPNGLTVITRNTAPDFLLKFPIEKIWGIGPSTVEALKKRGVETAGDFVDKPLSWVNENFSINYEVIWNELNCISVMKLNPEMKVLYSSIQKSRTFHPATTDTTFLLAQLSKHTEEACKKARQYGLVMKKFSFLLRAKDLRYTVCTVALSVPTNAPETILAHIKEKFGEVYTRGILYRATGVTLQNLTVGVVHQATLFDATTKADKFEAIHRQLDILERKLGKHVVHLGSTQQALTNMTEDIDFDSEERNLLFV
jgi:nucleotidyltransferase/DNA polymerase involved in DNA repair